MQTANSQAVLNTLSECDFQHALKNGRSAGIGAYARRRDFFKGDGGQ
jgi:hypothetical protein